MELKPETLSDYYLRINQRMPAELLADAHASHFNLRRRSYVGRLVPYNRRDYYKICLVHGNGIFRFHHESVHVDRPCIIFSNPELPSSWESLSEKQDGFCCLFNDAFLLNNLKHDVKYDSALFNPGIFPLIFLDDAGLLHFQQIYSSIEALLKEDYVYKYDMIASFLQLLIHEGIRRQGGAKVRAGMTATDRLVREFLHLLDLQFPVDSLENPLQLMTPAEYASRLNVHVNHLNAVVKRLTGKSTREVIREKVVTEAKKLLLNTEWDAAEIAYTLGFEYPSHFSKYFKQHTGVSPLLFRQDQGGSGMGERRIMTNA